MELTLLFRDPKDPRGLRGPLLPMLRFPLVVRFESPGSPGEASPVPVLVLIGLDAWVGEVGLNRGALTCGI